MNYIMEQIKFLKQSISSIFKFSHSDLIRLKKQSENFLSSDLKSLQNIGNIINTILLYTKRIKNNNKFIFTPKILFSNNRIFINNFHIYKDELVKKAFEIVIREVETHKNEILNLQYIDINASIVRFFLENYQELFKKEVLNELSKKYKNENFDVYSFIAKLNNLNEKEDRDIVKQNIIKSLTKILYEKLLNENDINYLKLIFDESVLYKLANANYSNYFEKKNYYEWLWKKQKEMLLSRYKSLENILILYINGDGLIFVEKLE